MQALGKWAPCPVSLGKEEGRALASDSHGGVGVGVVTAPAAIFLSVSHVCSHHGDKSLVQGNKSVFQALCCHG